MRATKSWPATSRGVDHAENQVVGALHRLLEDSNDYAKQPERLRASDGSTELLLTRICHLLETRVRSDAEEREKADVDEEIKNEWMLAAAVIDRILFITLGSLFIGGTLVFFVIFSLTP